MEILPELHLFNVPLESNSAAPEGINVYLLEGPQGSILVDTGWNTPGTIEKLLGMIAADGVKPESITDIIITHAHADHVGLASLFQGLSGARAVIHPLEANKVTAAAPDGKAMMDNIFAWLKRNGAASADLEQWSQSRPPGGKWLTAISQPVLEIEDGQTVSNGAFELKAIHTPGHAAGHLCLYERDRKLLFTGDHILPGISPFIGVGQDTLADPLADFKRSLLKVRDLQVELVLPAHGESFAGLRNRVEQLLHHHEVRTSEILDVLGDNPMSTYEIAEKIPWMKDLGARPFSELRRIDRRLAMMETAAHLAMLEAEGRAVLNDKEEVLTWTGPADKNKLRAGEWK